MKLYGVIHGDRSGAGELIEFDTDNIEEIHFTITDAHGVPRHVRAYAAGATSGDAAVAWGRYCARQATYMRDALAAWGDPRVEPSNKNGDER